MSDRLPKKNEALIRVRREISTCPGCGRPFDAVNANSHQATPTPESLRFYFQFLHGEEECIVETTAVRFEAWMAEHRDRH